jgi:signal transduction histidine kinase
MRNEVVISVRDSGVGVSEGEKKKIFERFHRLAENLAGSADTAGLGLAITKGLVEAHGGKIWVDGEIQKGSNFSFGPPSGAADLIACPILFLSCGSPSCLNSSLSITHGSP